MPTVNLGVSLMRLDLSPIILEAVELLNSIEAKSLSRSANSADRLLKLMPSPLWAETAPGSTVWTPEEKELTGLLNVLRCNAMTWMIRFCNDDISQESDDEWPLPVKLKAATQVLLSFGQNASVSANTVPTAS